MSSRRGSARSMLEDSNNAIYRRMVNLPRNIFGGFSRVVNQGIDLVGNIGGRRNQNPPLNFPPMQNPPSNFPPMQYQPQPMMIQEEWAFLSNYEQQFGTVHPFFYACRFIEALKIAQDEHKFLFMYLHSPDHPFTPSFCRETLCSQVVVQFLDANFVSWGGLVDRGEGLHMAATLRPATSPFCAIVAPAPGDILAVLQQIEGPVSPAELVEILQRTMEEQGSAFGGVKAREEEERRRVDRRIREEQDNAYLASLQKDQAMENEMMNLKLEDKGKKHVEASSTEKHEQVHKPNSSKKHNNKVTKVTRPHKVSSTNNRDAPLTQILIRFPNGERREKSFFCTEKIGAIYRYIDSLNLPGLGSYKLISSFPKKVYGVDQMQTTLKDAGLHPRASLFLELP
ncbi:plant UBX domain-containing protein 10-like [Apium graveolens]|uniref:plant UBX domain-containing protein 10-like n=1 Tax=Apium graveolens TaxID=4045 RepID=UPI003D7A1AF7